ncbi:hypothetical protein H5T55_04160 [Candidatus Bipolaricaulota bacterium]|nr:hypothetical protein [Candidatus Bipolaricaulota bacterium]
MNKVWILCAAALLAGSTALALDLSGQWTSGLTFTSGTASMTNTFTLHLAGSGWHLTSSWDPASLEVSSHTLVLKNGLGPVNVTAGVSFHLSARTALTQVGSRDNPFLWSADGFSFRSGFVSFELALGNLTLQLTFHRGPGE